jgi:hypothetical protein
MFRTIISQIERDKDYPPRTYTLNVLSRVLNGALYDHLPHGFHTEKNGAGEYVPLRDRRPSVKHNICRIAVEDSIALLFSEGHFPTAETSNPDDRNRIFALVKGSRLNGVMAEAARMGSVGSVAVQMRILRQREESHRLFFAAKDTRFLMPTFRPEAPDVLFSITEKYKVKGGDLRANGYAISDSDLPATFWFMRVWDESAEQWFVPWKTTDEKDGFKPAIDAARTVIHGLGFVPWVWIRNLGGKMRLVEGVGSTKEPGYSDVDGECTFFAAIDTMIEIDYQLSQGGRGLKYSMDPQLVIKEPPAPDEEIIRGATNALVLDKDGDAKLLELGGSAFKVVLEWVRALREFALEQIHGNRADASKLSAAQSGRAMELMNQALIWLADNLRINYGDAYRRLIEMAIAGHAKFPLTIEDEPLEAISPKAKVILNWPTWFTPTNRDLQEQATAVKTLRDAKIISRRTAVQNIAFAYDIEDVDAELKLIDQDVAADIKAVTDAASAQVTEQIRVTE